MSDEVCPGTGKRIMSRKAAMREAAWFRRTRHARMRHYKCKSCKAWHIGNNTMKPKRRRR